MMTLAQARPILRQLRNTLAHYSSNLSHVACGVVEPPPPATSCADVTVPTVTPEGLLLVPQAMWGQAEEAWAIFEASFPAYGKQWREGKVGNALEALNGALYLMGDRPNRGPFFFSMATVVLSGILAIKRAVS